jgi:hypothetical protein
MRGYSTLGDEERTYAHESLSQIVTATFLRPGSEVVMKRSFGDEQTVGRLIYAFAF